MIAAGMLAGAGMALGALLIAWGVAAHRPPLAEALDALLEPRPTTPDPTRTVAGDGWRLGLAQRVGHFLAAAGIDVRRLDADLRVVGRSSEEHLVEKATAALVGFALPPATVVLMRLGGGGAPWSLAFVGAFALGVAGFLLPDLILGSQAAERRRDFRYALSSYLDLAHMALAAGAGVETALGYAADAGEGWPFVELRAALRRSRLARTSPWSALERLGEDLDVPELREVASSLGMAGTHGARVKGSLQARAAALRSRDLADMEGEAGAATERMALPSVLMVVGFVVFVGFPALHEILGF